MKQQQQVQQHDDDACRRFICCWQRHTLIGWLWVCVAWFITLELPERLKDVFVCPIMQHCSSSLPPPAASQQQHQKERDQREGPAAALSFGKFRCAAVLTLLVLVLSV